MTGIYGTLPRRSFLPARSQRATTWQANQPSGGSRVDAGQEEVQRFSPLATA